MNIQILENPLGAETKYVRLAIRKPDKLLWLKRELGKSGLEELVVSG